MSLYFIKKIKNKIIKASLIVGLISILISSIKPRTKKSAQIDKYSKKIIFLNRKKLKIIISNEKNMPNPPAIEVANS
jgi:hypothetical protein